MQSLSASAPVGLPAPSTQFTVDVNGLQNGQQVYLSVDITDNGISDLTDSGSLPDTVTVLFKDPASLGPGTYTDTVRVAVCQDQSCMQQISNSPQTVQVTYTVNASTVTLTSLSPTSVVAASPPFTLTVTGTNFTSRSKVLWNGQERITTFVSATQLSAQIDGGDVADSGSATVTVSDATNGLSGPLSFTIVPVPLALHSVSPTRVTAGGPAFTLTVLGAGYGNTSTVQWNGAARPTTFVSSREILATISAADIAATGTAQVIVTDPANSVTTTGPLAVTIAPPSKDAVAFQMNPAHTGSVNFASVNFPSGPTWSVDVGGLPSYALIAQGLVYVTALLNDGTSRLIALDQADGHTVWGPIVIAGAANAAYDSGRVFVASGSAIALPKLEAYDASTGQRVWSTALNGGDGAAGVAAMLGQVFINGAALDQATGAQLWTGGQQAQYVAPAVRVDAYFVAFRCTTEARRPLTGEIIWRFDAGCVSSSGFTPVVANQMLYAPNQSVTYNGTIFDATTGVSNGTYQSDDPPAFTSATGYFLQTGTLRGVSLSNNSVLWSFAGDGRLVSSPIAVNQYVFIGSYLGNLYALDGATGQQVWQQTLPNPVPVGTGSSPQPPMTGLAAGDGLLVVPNGTSVTAYTLSSNP